jgi:hypothetical protein
MNTNQACTRCGIALRAQWMVWKKWPFCTSVWQDSTVFFAQHLKISIGNAAGNAAEILGNK